MSKPDSNASAIVAALRKAGASVVYHDGRKGEPDLCWGFAGRMGWAEVKAPGKESGVCGCRHTEARECANRNDTVSFGVPPCSCKGHIGTGNAERETWHAQLAFREAWRGPMVSVWTTVEQALREIQRQGEHECHHGTSCSGTNA